MLKVYTIFAITQYTPAKTVLISVQVNVLVMLLVIVFCCIQQVLKMFIVSIINPNL